MEPICTTSDLEKFCASLVEVPFITVDTEFIREKTYWPQVCLIQISGPDIKHARAIDPLAPGIDLGPLLDLMQNPDILKVFHAASQDIEIFFRLSGKVPTPLFDTQVAAMACGFGDSVSYETLVTQLAKGKVDKSLRFTDWAARPLSERHLKYALSDVTYLCVIYEKLRDRLLETGRMSWLDEEMASLSAPSRYVTIPEEAWCRLKPKSTKPRFLAVLRELAAWREREAQNRDVPRQRLVRDDLLVEFAVQSPQTVDVLGKIRGYSRQAAEGTQGAHILAAIQRGLECPESDLPFLPDRGQDFRKVGAMVDLLRVLLRDCSEQNDVSQRMIASTFDLECIAAGQDDGVSALQGWRYEVFGKDALDLRAGKLAFTINAARKRLERVVL